MAPAMLVEGEARRLRAYFPVSPEPSRFQYDEKGSLQRENCKPEKHIRKIALAESLHTFNQQARCLLCPDMMGEFLVIEGQSLHARGDEFVLRGAIHQACHGRFRG